MASEFTRYAQRTFLDHIRNAIAFHSLRLYKNNFVPDEFSTAGAFVEADFSGYAWWQPTYSAAYINAAGKGQIDASSHTFVRGEGIISNDIYGLYVTDGAGEVVFYDHFANPIPMEEPFNDTIPYQFSPTSVSP